MQRENSQNQIYLKTLQKQTKVNFRSTKSYRISNFNINRQELAKMYWGKSLDQCTNQFCNTSWIFSRPFTQNSQQTPENNTIRIKKPKNSLKFNNAQIDKLSEKRSLKKSQNNIKSQASSSVNTFSIFFTHTKNSMEVPLSKKTSIRNFSQREPTFSKKIHNPSTNDNTLRCNNPKYYGSNDWNPVNTGEKLWQKQNKTKDCHVSKFTNQLPASQSIPKTKFSHTRNSFNQDMSSFVNSNTFGQENSFRRQGYEGFENVNLTQCVSPNGRNYQTKKMQKGNMRIYDPRELISQTVRYQNSIQNIIIPRIQPKSPQYMSYSSNQRYIPVQSIQNLVNDQTQRYPLNQFPTIREQNQTYEQSKSINDYSNARQLNSIAFYGPEQKTQNFVILGGINNSLSQEQQNNQETFYDVIRNKEPEFEPGLDSSDIQGNNKVSNFDLSCEELLLESQKSNKISEQLENLRIYEQIKRSYQKQENNVQTQRRQMHQPSICIRVIQNKLRGTSYLMSQTSSQGYQSQFRSSNALQSRQQVIPSFPSPQTITSPRQRQGSQALSIKSPCKVKILKNSVRFNLEKKSGFSEDKQNKCEHKSPIKILDSDRQIELHNLATFGKEKQKHDNHLVHQGLLKQLSLNDIHSGRDHQPSIRQICVHTKKVKSLIQHKITIDSIFEDSSSFGNKQCSNQLITKYILDENFENLDGLQSNQNVDRDESTVIDRYTFDSRLEKLP